mgnify:CR=1 FL=1
MNSTIILKKMLKLYEIWNSVYEKKINNKQRLIKVYQEIDRLSKIKNEVIQYYKDNHKKLFKLFR